MHALVVRGHPAGDEEVPGMNHREKKGRDQAQNEPSDRPSSHSGAQPAPQWDGARPCGGTHRSAPGVRHTTPRVDCVSRPRTRTEKSPGALEILCLWARVLL